MPRGTDNAVSEPSQRATMSPLRFERVHTAPLVVEPEADQELRFKISADSEARISFRGEVTAEAIEKLIKLLELSKDTFPSTSEPKPATTQALYDAIKAAAQDAIDRLGIKSEPTEIARDPEKNNVWWVYYSDLGRVILKANPGESVEQLTDKLLNDLVARNYD